MRHLRLFGFVLCFSGAAGVLPSDAWAQIRASRLPIPRDVPADLRRTLEKFSDVDPAERARAVCRLRDASALSHVAIPFLIELLGDETPVSPTVCPGSVMQPNSPGEEAASALAEIGEPAVESLLEALKEPRPGARKNAASTLGKIGDGRAMEPLLAALADEVPRVRREACGALGRMRATRAFDPISKLLVDANPEVREVVAEALVSIDRSRAAEFLIGALRDANAGVREAVSEALGEARDPNAVLPLIAVLADDHREVRRAAAEALGEIGDARASEALRKARRDADREVRDAASDALQEIAARKRTAKDR